MGGERDGQPLPCRAANQIQPNTGMLPGSEPNKEAALGPSSFSLHVTRAPCRTPDSMMRVGFFAPHPSPRLYEGYDTHKTCRTAREAFSPMGTERALTVLRRTRVLPVMCDCVCKVRMDVHCVEV